MASQQDRTVIIGISGPSSSGKTTLARLLQRVFCGVRLEANGSDASQDGNKLNTFIIHEDDFYYPDDEIPWTTTPSGIKVQDWDTAGAIDIDFLAQALAYVRSNGHLPPRLQSKEDQNAATDSGVDDAVIVELRDEVESKLSSKLKSTTATAQKDGQGQEQGQGEESKGTIAFLEGFLLFSPPSPLQPPSQQKGNDTVHTLRPVHSNIHLSLFLPCSYDVVKARREGRTGYVTIGPGPEPPGNVNTNTDSTEDSETDKMHHNMENRSHMPLLAEGGAQDTDANANANTDAAVPNNGNKKENEKPEIDLNGPDDRPPQNFWTDPPGYVDDIVWPRYVEDHAWLLLPEEEYKSYKFQSQSRETKGKGMTTAELIARVGDGSAVRTDVGVEVAPGRGELPMSELLRWAVDKVLASYGS